MDKKEYLKKLKIYTTRLRLTSNKNAIEGLNRAIFNLKSSWDSKGRVGQKPIKAKLREKKPHNCIRACCEAQGISSYTYTSKIFDYVKVKK